MYETLTQSQDGPDDLGSMVLHLAGLVPWKSVAFIFILFLFINTTTFVDRILGSWEGAVEGRFPTEKGLMIQAVLLTLGLVVFSVCANSDLV